MIAARRMRHGLFVLVACALFAAGTRADAPAEAQKPEAVFKNRNLSRTGFWLLLPNEAAVHDGVWALKQADEGLKGEAAGRRNLKMELDASQKRIDAYQDQYATISAEYEKAAQMSKGINKSDTALYNQWNDQKNSLAMQSNVLIDKIDREHRAMDDVKTREEQVEDSRGRYIGLVMDIGTKAESVADAYAKLAQDAELTAAIGKANVTATPQIRLGPSTAFQEDLKFIRTCVKNVVTGAVPIRKSPSGTLYVEVELNGNVPATMQWDTGADFVSLSPKTWHALALDTSKFQNIPMRIADGTTVQAKQATLDSVRLGAFTLRDVDCVLMPDIQGANANNLLGDSFQSHFLSRLDQRSGQLQLTPIDSSIVVGPQVEPLPKPKPDPNPGNLNLARRATVTASSTEDGFDPAAVIDGVIAGAPKSPQNEWACAHRTGAITLTWPDPVILSSVKLWDRQNKKDHILSGQLVFDDNSTLPFGALPKDGSALLIRFKPKYVKWMRVEILRVSDETEHPGLAEIGAFR
jgi:clan AA aspartic protease (TIGR02281 family)